MLIGRVDELQNGKIYGWAFNEDQPNEHLVIRVMRGAQVVATGVANIVRRDLAEGELGDGDHAFEIPTPPNVVSFQGLMIIAQSQRSGELPLPVANNEERRFDEMFSMFSERYEQTLAAFKVEIDDFRTRCDAMETTAAPGKSPTELPDDLAQRLIKLEARMDASEVFFIRIDEMVKKLVDQSKKGGRKRFLGIF
jgi:hypothetical protein